MDLDKIIYNKTDKKVDKKKAMRSLQRGFYPLQFITVPLETPGE
jgi:hypothetical protein